MFTTILIILYTFGVFTSAQFLQEFPNLSENNFENVTTTLPLKIQNDFRTSPTQINKNIFNVKIDDKNDGKYRPEIHNRNNGNNGKYRPDDRGRYIHQHVPYDGGYGDKGHVGGKYIHNDISYKGENNYDDDVTIIENNIYNDTRFNDRNNNNNKKISNNNENNDISSIIGQNLIINNRNNKNNNNNNNNNNNKSYINLSKSSGFDDIKNTVLKNVNNIIDKNINNNYENENENINNKNNNYINSQSNFNSFRAINNVSSKLINLFNSSDIKKSRIQNDELPSSSSSSSTSPSSSPSSSLSSSSSSSPSSSPSSSSSSLNNRVKYNGWKIIRDNRENNPPYHYLYETENKILAEETGRLHNLKNMQDNESIKAYGFYEYYGDDGKKYHIDYTADEYGYIPKGNHIHKSILKALEYQLQMAKKQ